MYKFVIACVKVHFGQATWWHHNHCPSTLEEALKVGHELTRDYVCDAFRVTRVEL